MTATLIETASPRASEPTLARGRELERLGRAADALAELDAVVDRARNSGDRATASEALRRSGVLRFQQGDRTRARAACREAAALADRAGLRRLAAEAFNTSAVIELESGELDEARALFQHALRAGGDEPVIRARVEQNLGIIANVQGDWARAEAHYGRSLEGFLAAGDRHGTALACHNLGMVAADQRRWEAAAAHYRRSLEIAQELGDSHLEGLCRLNYGEVLLGQGQTEEAGRLADRALAIFDQLDSKPDKAGAYLLLGMIYRESQRPTLAEARLKGAIDLFAACGSTLGEAEASRETALLYRQLGRNREALTLLTRSHRLFQRLDARVEQVDISAKVRHLEDTYLAVVRSWGESIESADSYTHGHCERVADYAVALARELGLTDQDLTAIRVGAYLHDLGKVKVPHEILNKPGRLTADEFDVIKRHPVWGVEMLSGIPFPWDVEPIIRWHHEKRDGTGYPDRLVGDEIPLSAQIIGIVDVFDALTTTRSYRGAMRLEEALERLAEARTAWRDDVYEAFLRVVTRLPDLKAAA